PKLCRSACPVSSAEPRETLTPWGKMSMVYFVANESVAPAAPFAAPAWACTGCYACREQCDHGNDVAGTPFESRGALAGAGRAPAAATRVERRFGERTAALAALPGDPRVADLVDPSARVGVLVGCMHARLSPDVASATILAVARLTGSRVAPIGAC